MIKKKRHTHYPIHLFHQRKKNHLHARPLSFIPLSVILYVLWCNWSHHDHKLPPFTHSYSLTSITIHQVFFFSFFLLFMFLSFIYAFLLNLAFICLPCRRMIDPFVLLQGYHSHWTLLFYFTRDSILYLRLIGVDLCATLC